MTHKEWRAKFIGGPIGGTEKILQECLPLYRVPVLDRRHNYIADATQPYQPEYVSFDTATYELDQRSRRYDTRASDGDKVVYGITYYWQDPSSLLKSENTRLKTRIKELEREADQEHKLREAVKAISSILAKG